MYRALKRSPAKKKNKSSGRRSKSPRTKRSRSPHHATVKVKQVSEGQAPLIGSSHLELLLTRACTYVCPCVLVLAVDSPKKTGYVFAVVLHEYLHLEEMIGLILIALCQKYCREMCISVSLNGNLSHDRGQYHRIPTSHCCGSFRLFFSPIPFHLYP